MVVHSVARFTTFLASAAFSTSCIWLNVYGKLYAK